jgi:hypothetical protein
MATNDLVPNGTDSIAIRLSPFIPSDPVLWFSLVEVNFATAGITSDDRKFALVANSLQPSQAIEVRDILVTPPSTNKYEKLKSELIKRLSTSQEAKTRRLLEQEDIGDRRPSQFLRHLKGLAGPTVPDALLRTLWIGRLPRGMQMILATQSDESLEKLADIADVIAENTSATPVISAASENSVWTAMQRQVETLQAKIEAMTVDVDRNARYRSRTRSRSRSRSRPRKHSTRDRRCWYHYTFGAKAEKCNTPCSYEAERQGNASGSH